MHKLNGRTDRLVTALFVAAMISGIAQAAPAQTQPPTPISDGQSASPSNIRRPLDLAPVVAFTLVPKMNATLDLDVPGGLSGPLGSLKSEYAGFGQEEKGSPPLQWTKAPAGTRSLVLILQDMPPTQALSREKGGALHWAVYNIPPDTISMSRDVPEGENVVGITGARQLKNSLGFVRYLRPGPPVMVPPSTPPEAENELSIYSFQLFALDNVLEDDISNLEGLVSGMKGHVLAYGIEHIVLQLGKMRTSRE